MQNKKTVLIVGQETINAQLTHVVTPEFKKTPLNIGGHPVYTTFDPDARIIDFCVLTNQSKLREHLVKTYDTKKVTPNRFGYSQHIAVTHRQEAVEISKYNETEKMAVEASKLPKATKIDKELKPWVPFDYHKDPFKYNQGLINHKHFGKWLSQDSLVEIKPYMTVLHRGLLDQRFDPETHKEVSLFLTAIHNDGQSVITLTPKQYDSLLCSVKRKMLDYCSNPAKDPEIAAGFNMHIRTINVIQRMLRDNKVL